MRWRLRKAIRSKFKVLLVVIVYLAVGMVAYRYLERDAGWSLLDSLYFAVTAVATVGYGCLSPSTGESRGFTLTYVACSIPLVPVALGFLLDDLFKMISVVIVLALEMFHESF